MKFSESNTKIGLSFFIAISLSILIFLFVMWILPDSLFLLNENFLSQHLDEKKIFVLGSSHVNALNPIIISKELEKGGYSFTVYNIGQPGEDFEERERTVNMIIKQKPQIVIYGIEPRSFETQGRTLTQLPEDPLPHIGSINDLFDIINFEKKGILKNPKFALLRSISIFSDDTQKIQNPYPNTPFFIYDEKAEYIVDFEILKNTKMEYVANIESSKQNTNLFYLKNIIKQLQDNNIEVILFVTPHSQFYVDNYPENLLIIFQELLDDISNTTGIQIFSLYDDYSRMNVWYDHTHLAITNTTNFYNNDVANFIKNRLES